MKSFFRRAFGEAAGPSAAGVLIFAALLAVYANCVTNSPSFELKYSLYPDLSNVYWIQAFNNASLFPGDRLAALNLAQMGSCTETLWLKLTALFMRTEPCTYGLKLLSVLAFLAAALCVRRLAAKSPARASAGAAAVLFAFLFISKDTFFGVPRVYGVLLFLAFALELEERKFFVLPFLAALQFAFYPSGAPMLAVSAALIPFFFRSDFSERKLLPRYAAALAAGAALTLFFVSQSALSKNAAYAFKNGFGSHKFYQMVSVPLDPRAPLDLFLQFFLNLNEDGSLYAIFAGLLAAACAAGFALRPGRLRAQPKFLPALLSGSVIAFALIYPVNPTLASRQTIFIIPLVLVFLAAEALGRIPAAKPSAIAAVCAAVFLALHPFLGKTKSYRGYAGVYEYLAGLPQNAVAACYPGGKLAETVPLFAKRRTFLADDFYDQLVLRLGGREDFFRKRKALLAALYAGETRELEKFGADCLVFEKRHYEKGFAEYLSRSASPLDREAAAVMGSAPEKIYAERSRKAVFSWKNGESEGFVLSLGR